MQSVQFSKYGLVFINNKVLELLIHWRRWGSAIFTPIEGNHSRDRHFWCRPTRRGLWATPGLLLWLWESWWVQWTFSTWGWRLVRLVPFLLSSRRSWSWWGSGRMTSRCVIHRTVLLILGRTGIVWGWWCWTIFLWLLSFFQNGGRRWVWAWRRFFGYLTGTCWSIRVLRVLFWWTRLRRQRFWVVGCSRPLRFRCRGLRALFLGTVFFLEIFYGFWCRTMSMGRYHLYLLVGHEVSEVELFDNGGWRIEPLDDKSVLAFRHVSYIILTITSITNTSILYLKR